MKYIGSCEIFGITQESMTRNLFRGLRIHRGRKLHFIYQCFGLKAFLVNSVLGFKVARKGCRSVTTANGREYNRRLMDGRPHQRIDPKPQLTAVGRRSRHYLTGYRYDDTNTLHAFYPYTLIWDQY